MALNKEKKKEILKELEEDIAGSKAAVFLSFRGLSVADETVLRREMREQGVSYKVARKTLLRRALEGKAKGELPSLEGEVAAVFSKDSVAGAREVYAFQKTHPGILSILGGIFEGSFVGSEKMTEIASIPSREVLLAKLAFLLRSPLQRLAVAVGEVAKKK